MGGPGAACGSFARAPAQPVNPSIGRRRPCAQWPPASSAALPPAAAVLMVRVCSAQKRYR